MSAPGEEAPPEEATRTLRALRITAVVAVGLGLLVAWQLGLFETFGEPTRLRDALVALGPLGYLAFVVAYTFLQPFGVPGTVFVFAAPLIWPWPVAFALNMTGTMTASVVGFAFARFVARDAVARYVPARFRRYEGLLERRGFATVFLLRFVFWMPPLLHAFFGVSRVGFWTHFWGSLVGYLLPLLAVSYFGEAVFELALATPMWAWVALTVAAVAIGAIVWAVRRRARLRAPAGAPRPGPGRAPRAPH